MRFFEVVAASRAVADTSGRLAKIALLADLLKRTPPDELEIVVAYLTGEPRQGRLGIGWAQLSAARDVPAADAAVTRDSRRRRLLRSRGRNQRRAGRLRRGPGCFAICSAGPPPTSRTFSCGCCRRAAAGRARRRAPRGRCARGGRRRRAGQAGNDARRRHWRRWRGRRSSRETRRCHGSSCSRSSRCSRCWPTRRPTSPTRSSNLGEASFEYKLDGARIQAHKVGDEVRVFSRNLRDVTDRGSRSRRPWCARCRRASWSSTAKRSSLRPDGTPQPFQITMRRFGRKLDVDRLTRDAADHAVLLRRALRRRRRTRRRAADAADRQR